ncbi:MAG: hypothetical protein QM493_10410 [Sulfurovum sp.]
MLKTKLVTVLLSASMLIGCGSSTDTLASVDNSKNTTTQNQYGYFGDNVIFGSQLVTNSWTLYHPTESGTIIITYYSSGENRRQQDSSFVFGDYGVSQDGKTISSSNLNDITIVSVKRNYLNITNTDGSKESKDCYEISGGDAGIIMCP